MRSIRRLNLAALMMALLILAGCEVEGSAFKRMARPSTKAIIYVYRPYHYIGSIEEPEITCGSGTIAIGAGGYHAFVEEPGTIKCYAAAAQGNPISFEARPETDYFVREIVSGSLTTSQVTLTKVDRATGLDEIESTRTPQ
ncbi:MAG TPA: hypothetical protein VMV27_03195 [Candidatus Binataceae bacterium]|nr:hypothetical protein [Candidatus Binataceae bacterium]